MKKTLLILLSFSFWGNLSIKAQDTEKQPKIKWSYLRFYTGVMPGFEVYKRDSANITAGFPTGVNFRHYSKRFRKTYWDADASNFVMILETKHYVSFYKISGGFGFSPALLGSSGNTYYAQVHVSFARDIFPVHNGAYYGNLIGVGYEVQAQSIPVCADYMKFTNNNTYFILLGIKVPLYDIRL